MSPMKDKTKVLMCSPGENCEGGIAAVVMGFMKGFDGRDDVCCRRIRYGKPWNGIHILLRIFVEIYQYLCYQATVLSYRPDIIHLQSSFSLKSILRDSGYLLVGVLLKKKVIYHAHGGYWQDIVKWPFLLQRYVNCFLSAFTLVIVTSKAELDCISQLYNSGIRVVKLNNPVEKPILEVEDASLFDKEYFNVVFASRLIDTKGVLDGLEAMNYVSNHKIRLYVFGDGPQMEQVRQWVLHNGRSGDVFVMGSVSLACLLQYYSSADAYIFPSFHPEGFPMSLFYALSCSLPVICTEVRPLPEYLTEPDNCLWIKIRDPKMLAKKLDYLAINPEVTDNMRRNNSKMVGQFS